MLCVCVGTGDMSVHMTCRYTWHVGICDMSVHVTCRYTWRVSTGDMSVQVTYQYRWHVSTGDMSVHVTCQYRWHVGTGEMSVQVTCRHRWHVGTGDMSVQVTCRRLLLNEIQENCLLLIFNYFSSCILCVVLVSICFLIPLPLLANSLQLQLEWERVKAGGGVVSVTRRVNMHVTDISYYYTYLCLVNACEQGLWSARQTWCVCVCTG